MAAMLVQYVDPDAVNKALDAAAAAHGVDPRLVHAVAMTETGKNPWQNRAEPGFRRTYLDGKGRNLPGWMPAPNQVPNLETELTGRAQSWGVMQILGETARELGFNYPWFGVLFIPDIGAEYGVKYLRKCLDAAGGDVKGGLFKYNGGADAGYPARVLAHLASL